MNGNNCGAGLVIKIGNDFIYKGWLRAGSGSNTRAEVVGLWSLLFFAKFLGVQSLQDYGVYCFLRSSWVSNLCKSWEIRKLSQVIINWAKGEVQVQSLDLYQWLENIKSMMKDFAFFSFQPAYLQGAKCGSGYPIKTEFGKYRWKNTV